MKLMKKLRPFLVLLLILSFVSVSVASPGKYARLNEGEVLPWDGWCFDGNAMAEIVADKELEQQRCELAVLKRLEEQQAKFDLQIGQLNATMEYEIQTRDTAIRSLQQENLKIEEALLHQNKFGWIAPASFGVIIGALTIFLVTL